MVAQMRDALGTADGVNAAFETANAAGIAPVAYVSGTLAVWEDMRLVQIEQDNGFVETDPATGKFDFKVAPPAGALIKTFFDDGTAE